MRIADKLLHILKGVGGSFACTKTGRTNVHRIGPIANGSNALLKVLCRR